MASKNDILVATVTVSDTRTIVTDESGALMRTLLEEGGFSLLPHQIVRDEPRLIGEVVSGPKADAIIFSGGTGIAPRDQTFEALDALLEKKLDGFGEAFRRLSWDEIGPRALLSRAVAGVIGTTIVFSLPGSRNAVRLGVKELISPILGHAVSLLRGETTHGRGVS